MTTLRQRTALDAIAISRAPISGHGESFSTAALHACAQAFVATLTSATRGQVTSIKAIPLASL